jgi:hypothetical protein
MDTTNVFNNKKFAILKNDLVVNVILLETEDESILSTIIEQENATSYLDVTENIYVGVGSYLVNNEITAVKPQSTPSAVWDSELKAWVPPIPSPGINWEWDEELQEWHEIE